MSKGTISSSKTYFCTNSRRWLETMDLRVIYPSTCPYGGDCDRCGYLEEREPSNYLIRKKKLLFECFTEETESLNTGVNTK